MEKRFRLYWLRETGCDTGTAVDDAGLDGSIRTKVLELAGEDKGPITVSLPFLDHREWARRSETMRVVELERDGDTIRAVHPSLMTRLKDRAAELKAIHPVWKNAPAEGDRRHFGTWRAVSVASQKPLRIWLPEIYLHDTARFEDRDSAYAFLVYSVSRPFRGRPKTEFAYDVADSGTLPAALRMTKQALESALARTELRLREHGRTELARRYAPVWAEDISRAVIRNPRRLFEILGSEAMLVNAMVELGSKHSLTTVKPFAKGAMASLRRVCAEDFRELALPLLETATEALAGVHSSTPRRMYTGSARENTWENQTGADSFAPTSRPWPPQAHTGNPPRSFAAFVP